MTAMKSNMLISKVFLMREKKPGKPPPGMTWDPG